MLYCRSSQLPEQRLEAPRRPPRASLFLISAPTNARGERHIHCDLQQYSLRSCKSLGVKWASIQGCSLNTPSRDRQQQRSCSYGAKTKIDVRNGETQGLRRNLPAQI